jgi:hypothetical protein
LLGKHNCQKQRRETYHLTAGSVLMAKDYADRFGPTCTNEIQSSAFGRKPTVGLEGATVQWGGNDNMDFHCFFSDDKRQDSRVTYLNTRFLILQLIARASLLSPRHSVLYETMDGCSKQYRSGTALFLMAYTAVEFSLCINRLILAPGHGKSPIDSQNGVIKSKCNALTRMVSNPESPEHHRFIKGHTVKDGKFISMAQMFMEYMEDPRNGFVRGHRKHQKREEAAKIKNRFFHVTDLGEADVEANCKVPLQNSK